MAWTLIWLGEYHRRAEGDVEKDEQNAQEALKLFRILSDAHGMAESLQVIGRYAKNHPQRMAIYMQQLEIDQANGDVEGIATAYHFLGVMNFINADYAEALIAFS